MTPNPAFAFDYPDPDAAQAAPVGGFGQGAQFLGHPVATHFQPSVVLVELSAQIQLDELAQTTDGYSGAEIESVIKEGIEQAFVDGCQPLDTSRLQDVIKNTHPLREVMGDKVSEYEKRFEKMKIKPAS